MLSLALLVGTLLVTASAQAQERSHESELQEALAAQNEFLRHRLDRVSRQVDDLMFFMRLGDIADIEWARITGPPLAYQPNPTAQGAGNPFIFYTYIFIPKDLDRSKKQPLIVMPHGGVHSNFGSSTANILRELLVQGYTIVAPEYRGSTGYGRRTYEAIDYGGLEIEDTYAARNHMIENYDFIDDGRVGLVGWSHGGLHALMNLFAHGEEYAAAYAGVPVSDLIARMGYKTQGYRDLYSEEYHIGKTAYEDVEEYRRRSPSWNVDRYDGTPLLIYTTTNDQDVNVLEVERLIQGLQAAGKTGFEFKIFEDMPGGHSFDRLDSKAAKEIREDIWRFLARHLRPDRPVR